MDEWSISKLAKEDGSYWIIRKNLHPVSEGKKFDEYPVCIYFTVHYQPFTEEGFPSPDDNDAFEAIENELASICDGKHSVFVATVFMPGLKDYIVYTSNSDELGESIESLVRPYGQFKSELGGNQDPNWTQYESFA